MHGQKRKSADELEDEIAIAGSVDAVGGRSIEAQLFGHGSAVERECRSSDGAGAQRRNIQAFAAVSQTVGVTQEHFDIGQQPVRDQHRLRALQMSVGRHGRISRLLGAVERDAQPLRQVGAHLIYRSPNVKTQVGRDLLVAAAAAVQLVSRVPNQRDQLLFDKMVHVFRFAVVEKCR